MRRWWLWLEILLLLFFVVSDAALAIEGKPRPGCPEKCPPCLEEPSCEHTIVDQCNCCSVCVRHLGEKCGSSLGVCAANFTCTQLNDTDEFGVCTEMYPARCLKASCGVVFHPECPADSRLVIMPPPSGQCCGLPGKCHCDQQKCEAFVPTCEEGTERVLLKDGHSEPGECCDQFECQPKKSHCSSVRCPMIPMEEDDGESCPADSVRPAEHVPLGACCPVRSGCRCRASECRPAICPEGRRLKIIRKGNGNPGRCCDEWQCDDDPKPMGKSCERDGKTYFDGQEWSSSSCETCKCKKGVAVCSKMLCPKTPVDCTWVAIPEGECCPVCVGCQTDKREKKRKNESWQKDDCTTCTCSEEGMAVCEKYLCTVSCENPRKVEGQCCPVCDEPTILSLPATCPSLEHCPLRCENGLQRDDRGCFECKCLPSDHSTTGTCPQLSKNNCDKQCAHGYMKDNAGCVVCKCAKCPPLHQCFKHCLYGFQTNSAGCPVCKCRAISRIEATLTITDKIGRLAGWDKCVSVDSNSKLIERDSGEWWNDGCRHCFCEQKQEFCSLISCPLRNASGCPSENWVKKEGDCCHSCNLSSIATALNRQHEHTVCQSPGSGRVFTDGETWQLTPCISCTCRVGHVLCNSAECAPVACQHPELHPDNQCCPRCPASQNVSLITPRSELVVCNDANGEAHTAGSAWRTDDCTSCTCTNTGEIVCYRETCDPQDCDGKPLVVKGRCCPVCSDALRSNAMCLYKSSIYSINEEWKDGECTKCSCISGGQTVCKETVCPPCVNPIPIDGHCCPLCKDSNAFEAGNSGIAPPPPPEENNMHYPAFCIFISLVFFGLVVVFILFKRSRNHGKKAMVIRDPSVRLSSTKQIGSTPMLTEDWLKRCDSVYDGQSESLLSTVSDTSSAPSSTSSGVEPHPDNRPLTARKESRSKLFQCHV